MHICPDVGLAAGSGLRGIITSWRGQRGLVPLGEGHPWRGGTSWERDIPGEGHPRRETSLGRDILGEGHLRGGTSLGRDSLILAATSHPPSVAGGLDAKQEEAEAPPGLGHPQLDEPPAPQGVNFMSFLCSVLN